MVSFELNNGFYRFEMKYPENSRSKYMLNALIYKLQQSLFFNFRNFDWINDSCFYKRGEKIGWMQDRIIRRCLKSQQRRINQMDLFNG